MSESTFKQIRTASHKAALLTAIGATVALASLTYATWSLKAAIHQKEELTVQILDLENSLVEKSAALTRTNVEISKLDRARSDLQTKVIDLENSVQIKDAELSRVQSQISQARCVLAASRSAIEAFHQRAYEVAINLYGEALVCDPDNAYLLNLQAYSLFKAGRIEEAVAAERRSVLSDPSYAWGYFDLGRFLCAAGGTSTPEAKVAIDKALKLRPGLERIMRGDGEFMRLCKGLLP